MGENAYIFQVIFVCLLLRGFRRLIAVSNKAKCDGLLRNDIQKRVRLCRLEILSGCLVFGIERHLPDAQVRRPLLPIAAMTVFQT